MGDLSAHFSKAELACHCCGELKIVHELVDALELLRTLAQRPVVVHDGYRCLSHNQQVGGVTDSEHTRGQAADVSIPGLSLQQMFELALKVSAFFHGGIGAYDGKFLHLDIRPRAARWARVNGRYVGIHNLVATPAVLIAKVPGDSQPV